MATDDEILAGIDKAVEAGTMTVFDPERICPRCQAQMVVQGNSFPYCRNCLIDEVIDETFEDEPDGVDYAWEAEYRAHSSSHTGIFEAM
jgi:hypothetical protein